jgi:uncharacterized protein (DUF58 family)
VNGLSPGTVAPGITGVMMIKLVPTNRLLFWIAVIYLPFALLAAWQPTAGILTAVLSIGLTAFAGFDAFISRRRLDGISTELPPVIRLTRDRRAAIKLRVLNEGGQAFLLRIGLTLPRHLAAADYDKAVLLQPNVIHSVVQWSCRPQRQGRFQIEKCYLECPSKFGLWAIRNMSSQPVDIHVYPNLVIERSQLAGLFLNRGLGVHAHRQVGKGKEFEKLREYIAGDSIEDIHWKATAKRAYPITKIYQIERTQEVYLIIDASRLSGRLIENGRSARHRGDAADVPIAETILERYITAALIMGLATERQGDHFGLLVFDRVVRQFIRAKTGKAHFKACRDILYLLTPQDVSPDFEEMFAYVGTHLRRRALLIFLTHLDDPVLADSFAGKVNLVGKHHVILVNMLKPAVAEPLFTSAQVASINDIYRQLGGHILWSGIKETETVLKKSGIGFAMLENELLCTELISQYLSIKRRQLL